MPFSIADLRKRFGLSRSTLLYYEKIGLVKAASRGANNYRRYDHEHLLQLEKIEKYKAVGVSLRDIRQLIREQKSQNNTQEILSTRMQQIQADIIALKSQHKVILELMQSKTIQNRNEKLTKAIWVETLRNSGLSELDMLNWHREFEKAMPEAHTEFLISIGMSKAEIVDIKHRSKE